jgi:3-deoxy-manno-octulosonate cytidylyltransferase (CMP-KDO synthetase)
MKFIGIIPARFQSTRFPGKPLALIHGKPMIQWVYERASEAISDVWVATDDSLIFDTVASFGGKCLMTSADHQSGTDRCAEAARILANTLQFDAIVNIQGDEPFIKPQQLNEVMACFDHGVQIATLARKISSDVELADQNKPKVVVGKNGNALYFSRAAIPFVRGLEMSQWVGSNRFLAHVGLYAYRSEVLQEITLLEQGVLERAEALEQLRWLENGFKIKVAETSFQSYGIDTPEDLERALKLFPF